MNEPLKISILDRTDTEEFSQLAELLKEFTIETYIKNKPEYATLKSNKQKEYINIAIQEFDGKITQSILSLQDIEQLKQDINSQISTAKKLIDKKDNGNTQTRYYIMKDGDKLVAFQQGQIAKENGRTEGWSNLAYTRQDYRGNGQVIDSRGIMQEGRNSEILFEDLKNWFEENEVNYERTCTGVNMLRNIQTYIRYMGFLPFSKNDKNIFLEKSKEDKFDIKTLNKVFKLYKQHKERVERKNKDEIMTEIDEITEFESLTDEQKRGLVQCFLKEDEKEFEMPNDKIYSLFMEQYEQNPQSAIKKLKEYFKQIQVDNFVGILQTLGIELREDSIQELIETDDIRFENLEETKQFSTDEFVEDMQTGRYICTEQQIGKATINTPTIKKSEAQGRVTKDEEELNLEQEEIKE